MIDIENNVINNTSKEAEAHLAVGHAVAAMQLGVPFRHIDANDDGWEACIGFIEPDEDDEDGLCTGAQRYEIELEVISYMVGATAECRFKKLPEPTSEEVDISEYIFDKLDAVCGSETEMTAYLNLALIRACSVVDSPGFDEIVGKAVALLLIQDALSANELEKIFVVWDEAHPELVTPEPIDPMEIN